MEWIVSGIVGLVTGLVGSVVAPWVQAKGAMATEQARARGEHQRWLIGNARTLISEAMRQGETDQWVNEDWRYIAIKQHLDSGVVPDQASKHEALLRNLERLAREWNFS